MNVFNPYIQNGLGVRSAAAQKAYHDEQAQSGLQNAVAYQNALHGLVNAHTFGQREGRMTLPNAGKVVITETPGSDRTPEQIREQLEARYAEMEAEAERIAKAELTACNACRWSNGHFCRQPLVMGVAQKTVYVWDSPTFRHGLDDTSRLCGSEKALWEEIEPKLNLWQRFVNWFLEPWRPHLH